MGATYKIEGAAAVDEGAAAVDEGAAAVDEGASAFTLTKKEKQDLGKNIPATYKIEGAAAVDEELPQVQVYYIGFCDKHQICMAISDAYDTISKNKHIPSYVFFSCPEGYLDELPSCSGGADQTPQNLLLIMRAASGTQIIYNANPTDFLEMIGRGENLKLFTNKVCVVTIYGHGNPFNALIQFSKNCEKTTCQADISLRNDGVSLIDTLNPQSINSLLHNSGNFYIFIFFSCFAARFGQHLSSDNILAIIPDTCTLHELDTQRLRLPDAIIGDYENLYTLLSSPKIHYEIAGTDVEKRNKKKNWIPCLIKKILRIIWEVILRKPR